MAGGGGVPGPGPRLQVSRRRCLLVDAAAVLCGLLGWAVLLGGRLQPGGFPEPQWLYRVDALAGLLGCLLLLLRRRRPVHVAGGLVALSVLSESVAAAMLVAVFAVAVERPARITAVLFGSSLASAAVYVFLRPEADTPRASLFAVGVLLQACAVGWGLWLRSRRALVQSLHERAERAERDAAQRAERAQHEARDAIAREMHDVLGHRLSLLSVHAGALEYRPDAAPGDVARAAAVIRQSARDALQDLREIVGVMRAPVDERPQPTLADVARLVGESRRAGMRVDLQVDVGGEPPALIGRTAYRIIQEGLTNARKHAAGSPVVVTMSGAEGVGLRIEVLDCGGDTPPTPGGEPGRGLPGLGERLAISGGRIEFGLVAGHGWRLAAWLPWPA